MERCKINGVNLLEIINQREVAPFNSLINKSFIRQIMKESKLRVP